MIFNRLMVGLGVLAGFSIIGLLVMSYVSDNWGAVGVAVVVIALFLTFIFITVALIFAVFGLGMAHIFGKAVGIGPWIEMMKTMRAGYSAERNRMTLLDSPSDHERKLLGLNEPSADWSNMSLPGEFAPIDNDEFTVR